MLAVAAHRARQSDSGDRLLDVRVLLEIAERHDVAASVLAQVGVSASLVLSAIDGGAAAEVLAHEDILTALTPTRDEHRVAEIVGSVCNTSAPLGSAVLRRVQVRRLSDSAEVDLHTSTPGRVLGELGGGLETIAERIGDALGLREVRVRVVDDRSP